MIGEIFNIEFHSFLEELEECIPGTDLYGKKEKLSELTNEKTRVNKLFSNYSKISYELSEELRINCVELLRKEFRDEREIPNSGEALYRVRSLLVHRFYTLSKEEERMIDSINDALCPVITEILISFTKGNQSV